MGERKPSGHLCSKLIIENLDFIPGLISVPASPRNVILISLELSGQAPARPSVTWAVPLPQILTVLSFQERDEVITHGVCSQTALRGDKGVCPGTAVEGKALVPAVR